VSDVVTRFDERVELRAEALRVSRIAARAIFELERAGLPKAAASLSKELGIPIETIKSDKRQTRRQQNE
jgi:hypothetical protein